MFDSDTLVDHIGAALLPVSIDDGADQTRRDGQRQASVLMPLIKRDEWQVLLTQRPETMPQHAGQIAFPGGKQDDSDSDVTAAALREAHEEIGLPIEGTEILGTLPPHETVTGFLVTPVLAFVADAFDMRPEPGEVEEIFRVPLSHVLEPGNYVVESRRWRGAQRLYDMPYTEPDGTFRNIWGMTAMMMYRLYQRAFSSDS